MESKNGTEEDRNCHIKSRAEALSTWQLHSPAVQELAARPPSQTDVGKKISQHPKAYLDFWQIRDWIKTENGLLYLHEQQPDTDLQGNEEDLRRWENCNLIPWVLPCDQKLSKSKKKRQAFSYPSPPIQVWKKHKKREHPMNMGDVWKLTTDWGGSMHIIILLREISVRPVVPSASHMLWSTEGK